MFQLRIQLLFAVAFICSMATSTAAASQMCVFSGVVSDRGSVPMLKAISKTGDFDNLTMTYCQDGSKCYECTKQDRGIMFYSASCSKTPLKSDEMKCNAVGTKPCTSVTSKKCRPTLQAIKKMKKCRASRTKNMLIQTGGFDVYCNESCLTAVAITKDNHYMCKGCATDCKSWLEEVKAKMPSVPTQLCEEGQKCSFESMSSDDFASDESSGATRSDIGARNSVVALALAAGMLVGTAGSTLAV